MKKQVEICCGSYYDALQAAKGGAKRIELNSALHMGGLTPSSAVLQLVKQHTDLEVMVMIRPRGAGFHYGSEDFATMLLETECMLAQGADGIVFGCLDAQGNIDTQQCKAMLDRIKASGKQAVFHRAFDCVKDSMQAMETLIELGFDRVLTSGTKTNAMAGKEMLKTLQTTYGKQIEILAGCGVHAQNAIELMEYTGITQIHSSCKAWKCDPTTIAQNVNFSYQDDEHASDYEVVDAMLVKALMECL